MKLTKSSTLLPIFAVALNSFAQSPNPQAEPAAPTFEVASVKLSSDETIRTPGRRVQTSPGSLVTRGLPLRACIQLAYGSPARIIGPDWLSDVHLDIVARAATPVGDKQLYTMLRTLLTERMGLKTHVEKREMPAYVLTIAKGGPKFSASSSDGPTAATQENGALVFQRISMSELAAEVSRVVDRPVIDATGLTGRYDIRMDMAAVADVSQADRMDAAAAMLTALGEQMGLKAEGRKDWIDVLVIDHAEKTPAEN